MGVRLWQVEIQNRGAIASMDWNMSRHIKGFAPDGYLEVLETYLEGLR
jgi:hypothetical protein